MGSPEEKTTKPYSVRVTDNTLQNIDDITGYIAYINHQPLNAIRVGDAIFDTIDRIEKNPFAFRECEEIPAINKIYRKAVCQNWLIVYSIKDNKIVIPGICHAYRRASKIRQLRRIK
ncbi:MAG: type II toxin-antitoxin system RelE/ParE family toxin [Ignavibacteriales bacterium]|nr:MAG: type II toxin-antitoxin system RelE/ParE family toxin [Ignavibacteriales bacterium]